MKEAHHQLAEHFEELRHDRGELPIYFLEHGLDTADVAALTKRVSVACRLEPLTSPIWRLQYFPLLVVATEVGYTYRGTGTDFWPRLEERLSVATSGEDRAAISALFSAAAERLGGVAPADTRWARAFHHIAWPIVHAIIPIEFHRPFAQTLAALRQHSLDPTDDEVLFTALWSAGRGLGGERFNNLLANRGLVLALSRHFLRMSIDGQPLSPEVLRRVTNDLREDQAAARDVDLAYRLHEQSGSKRPKRRGKQRKAPADLEPLLGTLYLRRTHGSEIVLEAVLPSIDPSMITRARKALRRRRFSPRLWGVSARVPSDQLLSGLQFRIGSVDTLLGLSGPLLPDLESHQLDRAIASELGRLSLDLTPPLLFQQRADESIAAQVRGEVVTAGQIYWLLTARQVAPSDGVWPLGTLGEMNCVKIDSGEESGRELLSSAGVTVRFSTSARWIGDPPARVDAETPEYQEGDAIVLQVSRVAPEGVELRLVGSDEDLILPSNGLVSLDDQVGTHSVELQSGRRSQQVRYIVSSASASPALCWITLEGEEPSVQTLLNRACALRVDGVAPIDGLRLTLILTSTGACSTSSMQLPPLPVVVGPDDAIWDRLLTDRMCDVLQSRPSIQLRAVVGGLAVNKWHLEPRLRPCWWELGEGEPRLLSETGEMPFGFVSPAVPTADATDERPRDDAGVLLVPMLADHDELDDSGSFSGVFTAPATLSLRPPSIDCPRLLRMRSTASGGLGAERLITALLRWRLAEAVGPVADLRRRQIAYELEQWAVRVICGDAWARAEESLRTSFISPWAGLLARCMATRIGYDNIVKLTPDDRVQIDRYVIQLLQETLPDLWLDPLGAGKSESTYETLDAAFLRAYELLADAHRARAQTETADHIADADPYTEPEEWDEALLAAQTDAELHQVAEFVNPTTGGERLIALDYGQLNVDGLVEELELWVRDYKGALQGRIWDPAEIEAALCLWLDPERALRTPWRSTIDRLITDRWTSRAIRYVALRRRAALATTSLRGAAE